MTGFPAKPGGSAGDLTEVGRSARLLTVAQIGDNHSERGTSSRLSYQTTIASSVPRTAALLLSQALREP